MPFSDTYRRQAALLVRTLPLVAEEKSFALKGGTAINLFVRDLPRLSVDIDLTYLPVQPREQSLSAIAAALKRIGARLRETIGGAQTTESAPQPEGALTKLFVRADGVQINMEITPVMRGCVYDPEVRTVSPAVEEQFGFAEMPVVSFADLYAGKIVAALDRQHPRDFFDVRDLLSNEGIDDNLRSAFIVYLISHGGRMAEVLAPKSKDITAEFERGFDGMTEKPVALKDLLAARTALIADIVGKMPDAHRRFLVSFKKGEPDWTLLAVKGAENLPAVKWRAQNLNKLDARARAAQVAALEKVLAG